MRQPRLIKRTEQLAPKPRESKKATVSQTMHKVREWLQEKNSSTQQNAREAFAQLFVNPQKPCEEC